jgi:basic membrane lipoprotein Med (substrate-binding protein (PBP1-ABC) superfamily)
MSRKVWRAGDRRWPTRTRRRPGRWFWLAAGVVAAAGCAAGILAAMPGGGTAAPPARARQYLAYTACLLTDSRGLTASPASQVWAGMEDASLATHARVQYLPVPASAQAGTQDAGAESYVATLVLRHCGVVLATGAAQVSAVTAEAGRYPAVRFVVVGGTAHGANVTAVNPAPGGLRAEVAHLVTTAVTAAT